MKPIVITTTSDDRPELERIAKELVDQRLAACCQISGPITSIYRWNDSIEESQEWICQIKTAESLYDKVEAAIIRLHHFDQPEIIATAISAGSSGYLKWMTDCLDQTT